VRVYHYVNVNLIPVPCSRKATKTKVYVLAILAGASISLAIFSGISAVIATTNSYQCSLNPGDHCGTSYSAWSFDSDVTSNTGGSSSQICAGYVISGTVTCTDVVTGYGSSFSNSGSTSFSSYYKDVGSSSTTIHVSDIYCDCN
jgi:hypothetical protein